MGKEGRGEHKEAHQTASLGSPGQRDDLNEGKRKLRLIQKTESSLREGAKGKTEQEMASKHIILFW